MLKQHRIIKYLVTSQNFNCNLFNHWGTPLQYSMKNERKECVKALLECGERIDPTINQRKFYNTLITLLRCNDYKNASLLIANPHFVDKLLSLKVKEP